MGRGPLRRAAGLLIVLFVLSNAPVAPAQNTPKETARLDRLIALAKLWAAVKYFHPYLAYREKIDWDGALVRAIPRVNAAQSPAEYSAAVEDMLNELDDPVTRVLKIPGPAQANLFRSAERQPAFRKTADGVIVVEMRNYEDFQDFDGTREKLEALKKELPKARAILF